MDFKLQGVAWLVIRQTVRNAMVIMVQLDGKFSSGAVSRPVNVKGRFPPSFPGFPPGPLTGV
jgi:hypothetical protein